MRPAPTLETLSRLEAENASLRQALVHALRHIETLEATLALEDTDAPTPHRSSSLEFQKQEIQKAQ